MSIRVLLSMSRTWSEWSTVRRVLGRVLEEHPGATLVHGDAWRGDRQAAAIWTDIGGTSVEPYPANWKVCTGSCPAWHRSKQRCPEAGFRRNSEMVETGPNLCVAFIRGNSRGANDCATKAESAGIPTVRYTQEV